MHRSSLILFLAMALLAVQSRSAAHAADQAPPTPTVGTLIHDLRDFLPESESKIGNANDPIRSYSVKDDGSWKCYRSYNKNGTGYLSRTEIQALVVDLAASLRANYPDVYAEIDVDGEDTITLAKFKAYQQKHH